MMRDAGAGNRYAVEGKFVHSCRHSRRDHHQIFARRSPDFRRISIAFAPITLVFGPMQIIASSMNITPPIAFFQDLLGLVGLVGAVMPMLLSHPFVAASTAPTTCPLLTKSEACS